jgi:hypothetical protein
MTGLVPLTNTKRLSVNGAWIPHYRTLFLVWTNQNKFPHRNCDIFIHWKVASSCCCSGIPQKHEVSPYLITIVKRMWIWFWTLPIAFGFLNMTFLNLDWFPSRCVKFPLQLHHLEQRGPCHDRAMTVPWPCHDHAMAHDISRRNLAAETHTYSQAFLVECKAVDNLEMTLDLLRSFFPLFLQHNFTNDPYAFTDRSPTVYWKHRNWKSTHKI